MSLLYEELFESGMNSFIVFQKKYLSLINCSFTSPVVSFCFILFQTYHLFTFLARAGPPLGKLGIAFIQILN